MDQNWRELALTDKLGAWLDGELSAEEGAAIERLLADDPGIAAEVERLRRINAIGMAMPAPQVSDDEWNERFDAVYQAMGAAAESRPPLKFGSVAILSVLTSIAAVMFLVFALQWKAPLDNRPGDGGQQPAAVAVDNYGARVLSVSWNDDLVELVMSEQLDKDTAMLSIVLTD